MISRVLPHEEWGKLAGTEAEAVWPHLDPETTRVLVVEDAGEVVGAWLMLRMVHAECLWIKPSHRGVYGVAKRLLKGMRQIATEWGAPKVITGSTDPHVTELIERFGGVPMPCETFILPVEHVRRDSDRDLGRGFHRQLAALVPEDLHPDDEQHDRAVGRALRTAIKDHAPEQAMEDYNAWAIGAGYEPIRYLGTVDGRVRADIVTAVVEVDEQYAVRVVEQGVESCQQLQ